jgi:hypothetical protein
MRTAPEKAQTNDSVDVLCGPFSYQKALLPLHQAATPGGARGPRSVVNVTRPEAALISNLTTWNVASGA